MYILTCWHILYVSIWGDNSDIYWTIVINIIIIISTFIIN